MSNTVTIIVEKTIDCCNKCPYFDEEVDYSVCDDSFDEPNYDFYCTHPAANNAGTAQAKWNDKHGNWIGGAFSRFQCNCDIPSWCPFNKR